MSVIIKRWNGTSYDELYPKTTVGQIVASGTPSSANYLRGDGSWQTPTDTNTTYAMMTSTVLGLGRLFSDTEQSVAANAVSATTVRTYGIQRNASNQLVVNVPWTDTWQQNTLSNNGFVPSGSGNNNKVWSTDGSGNPAWRDPTGGSAHALNSHTDTGFGSPTSEQVIAWNNALSQWYNKTLAKADVALGSVLNYGIATQAEAEAGTVSNKYLVPQSMAYYRAAKLRKWTVAADRTNAILSLSDVSDFSTIAVTAGVTYRIYLCAAFRTAATTTGIRIGMYLSSGAGTVRGYFKGLISATVAATELQSSFYAIGASGATGASLITTGVSSTTIDHPFIINAVFTCTTSGNLRVQFCSEVDTSTATIMTGSVLTVEEI